jgi:hypothetical protein
MNQKISLLIGIPIVVVGVCFHFYFNNKEVSDYRNLDIHHKINRLWYEEYKGKKLAYVVFNKLGEVRLRKVYYDDIMINDSIVKHKNSTRIFVYRNNILIYDSYINYFD